MLYLMYNDYRKDDQMLEEYSYPAEFLIAEDGITVTFPDFDFIVTQGKTMQEAVEKASEVLGIGIDDYLSRGEILPKATDSQYIVSNHWVSLVHVNMKEWYKKNSRAN